MNNGLSPKAIEPLCNCLRQEISEYGGLVCLLNEQQKLIFFRDARGLMEVNTLIEKQVDYLSSLKDQRLSIIEGLKARTPHVLEKAEDFMNLCPGPYKSLVQDLIDNLLLLTQKIGDKTRQNHQYLENALQETQSLFKKLLSKASVATYTKKGNLSLTQASSNN